VEARPIAPSPEGTNYGSRPLGLAQGVLRLDLGPPDFAFMDMGELNNHRGVRFHYADAYSGSAWSRLLGLGAALGLWRGLEWGVLLPPYDSEEKGFGDLETYLLFSPLRGGNQFGVQVTVQAPTAAELAYGFGMPFRHHWANFIRLDYGFELEYRPTLDRADFDFPFSLTFQVTDAAFLGMRSGFRLVERWSPHDEPGLEDYGYTYREGMLPLGAFFGYTVGRKVDLYSSFTWLDAFEGFVTSKFRIEQFDVLFGANVHLDVF